jgi:hypothetical protein
VKNALPKIAGGGLALSAIAFGVAVGLTPQASAETRAFTLSSFDKINASAAVKVIVRQGAYAISVEEPDGRFDNLRLEVRDGQLFVGRKGHAEGRSPRYTVTVTMPSITAMDVSSAATMEAANLSLQAVAVDVSSGARATLSGSCTTLAVDVSSGARFDGDALRCETAAVDASSGGHAEAFASRTAVADASSGGHVTFHGQPAQITRDTSSGGSVSSAR